MRRRHGTAGAASGPAQVVTSRAAVGTWSWLGTRMRKRWHKLVLSAQGSLSSRHLLLQFLVQTLKEIKSRKVRHRWFPLFHLEWLMIATHAIFCATTVGRAAGQLLPGLLCLLPRGSGGGVLGHHPRKCSGALPHAWNRCALVLTTVRHTAGHLLAVGRAHAGRDRRTNKCRRLERLRHSQLHTHQVEKHVLRPGSPFPPCKLTKRCSVSSFRMIRRKPFTHHDTMARSSVRTLSKRASADRVIEPHLCPAVYQPSKCRAGLNASDTTWKYLGTAATFECPDGKSTCSDTEKIWCYEQAPGKCFQVT